MKIRTRKVTTSKSMEEAMKIIKSAAYYWPEGEFEQYSFSFYCARRHGGRSMMLIPVRGSMFEEDGQVTVVLEIYADLTFYVGCIFTLWGMFSTFCMAIMQKAEWYMHCMVVLFGVIVSSSSLLVASEILDRLEFKLSRKTEDG